MVNLFREFIQCVIIRSWWVMAFVLLSGVIYEQALKQPEALYKQFTEQVVDLQKQKEHALLQQQNLQLQINSQSDLAWVELTLMKGLGVVPEGQEKVYFYPDDP